MRKLGELLWVGLNKLVGLLPKKWQREIKNTGDKVAGD